MFCFIFLSSSIILCLTLSIADYTNFLLSLKMIWIWHLMQFDLQMYCIICVCVFCEHFDFNTYFFLFCSRLAVYRGTIKFYSLFHNLILWHCFFSFLARKMIIIIINHAARIHKWQLFHRKFHENAFIDC